MSEDASYLVHQDHSKIVGHSSSSVHRVHLINPCCWRTNIDILHLPTGLLRVPSANFQPAPDGMVVRIIMPVRGDGADDKIYRFSLPRL